LKKSVGALIIYRDKFLLQKRDNKKSIYFPKLWGVFGGLIEKKENASTAIRREVYEELNLKLKFKKFLEHDIFSKDFTPRRRRYFFFSKIDKNCIKKIILKEGKDFDFFSISQIEKLSIIPWDYAAIKYYYLSFIKKAQIKPEKISKKKIN